MSAQIEVVLKWKEDRNGKKYLFGNIGFPAKVDLTDMMAFIWPNPEDSADQPMLVIRRRGDRKEDISKKEDGYEEYEEGQDGYTDAQ